MKKKSGCKQGSSDHRLDCLHGKYIIYIYIYGSILGTQWMVEYSKIIRKIFKISWSPRRKTLSNGDRTTGPVVDIFLARSTGRLLKQSHVHTACDHPNTSNTLPPLGGHSQFPPFINGHFRNLNWSYNISCLCKGYVREIPR